MAVRIGLATAVLLAASAAPAHAAPMVSYKASNGDTVRIAGFPDAAPAYAEFLSQLPHGAELSSLRVLLADRAEVPRLCGDEAMTACYVTAEKMIIAPGPVLEPELLAHEYGHHLAAHRQTPPFNTLTWGPVHWASHQRVCAGMRAGRLGHAWFEDPAEAWAEVYVRLTFPELPWRLSPMLRPSESAFAAALKDVRAAPRPQSRTFAGRFGEGGSGRRTFRLPLKLDGTVELRLRAEDRMGLDLRVLADGRRVAFTPARALRFTACRRRAVERLTVEVRRRSGTGSFSLSAQYPG